MKLPHYGMAIEHECGWAAVRIIVAGQGYQTVDAETGECLRTLEGHQDLVVSVVFDPASRTLASGSYDRMIKYWEPVSGKLLCTLEGYKSWVLNVARK